MSEDFDFVIDITDHKKLQKLLHEFMEQGLGDSNSDPDWDKIRRLLKWDRMYPRVKLFEGEAPTLEEAREFVGGHVEIVHTKTGAQLVIDEEGHLKSLKLNPIPSKLYGGPIVGPAMILKGDAKWT